MSNKKPTQADTVLRHIARFGSITTFVAFNHYHITRLASRIHELREKGHPIQGRKEISHKAGGQYTIYYVDEQYRVNLSPKNDERNS